MVQTTHAYSEQIRKIQTFSVYNQRQRQNMFPVEIWQIIFENSDAVALASHRSVCKTWNEIIERVYKVTNLWQMRCRSDIPEYLWSAILGRLYPKMTWLEFKELRISPEMWHGMYRSWAIWHSLTDFSVSVKQLNPLSKRDPLERVTCVAVSENILAVGSSEGYIYFYDFDDLEKEPMYKADQMEYVSDIQFSRDETKIVAISSSITKKVRSWDVKSNKMIGVQCAGKLISTSYAHVCRAVNGTLIVEGAGSRKVYEFELLMDSIVALAANGDEVMIWTVEGLNFKVSLHNNGRPYIGGFVEPPNQRIRMYYIFKPHVAACITELGFLGLCTFTGEWELYNIFALLHGVPTVVLFHVPLLILGLDSGEVHVYRVKNVECLDTLDFKSMDSRKIVLDIGAIISLNILERPKEQYLIAASDSHVNIIKLT